MQKGTIQFIQTTPEEQKEGIIKGVAKLFEDLKQHFEPKTPTEYLTRAEVSSMLKVDISTVHNWTKKGVIKSYGIGDRRVYYKRAEVENAIVELKK